MYTRSSHDCRSKKTTTRFTCNFANLIKKSHTTNKNDTNSVTLIKKKDTQESNEIQIDRTINIRTQ